MKVRGFGWREILVLFGTILFLWFTSAAMVFRVKHPWATDMQMLMHVGDVLAFEEVSENE